MKARIYPVFIPFLGCPYRCVYCNQYATTSVNLSQNEVEGYIKQIIAQHVETVFRSKKSGEIAFFGGTFTSLPRDMMRFCLETATKWVENGTFSGIRFSTRPDCLDSNVLDFLSNYPVSTVELGAQSFDSMVLKVSGRRYTPDEIIRAASYVKKRGWRLGIQLMPGLPMDNKKIFMTGIDRLKLVKPEFVRLYPTVVVRGTVLEKWYRKGIYVPLTLKEAINWCVDALNVLEGSNISVIRMGLQATDELNSQAVVAGPYHPSFGYLVRVHQWRRKLDRILEAKSKVYNMLTVSVPEKYFSEFTGPSGINFKYWRRRWGIKDILIEKNKGGKVRNIEVITN